MSGNAARKLPSQSIVVNGAPIEWSEGGEGFSFYGIDAVLFWIKPSLVSMLQPLLEELGEDLYSRLVAFESSKGTFEDYSWMISENRKFEDGFNVWGRAVSAAGWGLFTIQAIDWGKKTATVTIRNPWELKILDCQDPRNSIPFLVGKMSGVFTHAFGTNCRADVVRADKVDSGEGTVVLKIQPSLVTLEQALVDLHGQVNAPDKSQLRALNNALRRNERRLLDVVSTVGDFIWESNSKLEISFATDPVYKILQLPEGSVVGKSWQMLLPAVEFDHLKIMLRDLSGSARFVEGEFYIEQSNGKKTWILLRVKRQFDFNGNHSGYVGSGSNITNRKNLEAQVEEQRKNAEASAKMATLGEMAGGVAHEINTPLAVISLVAESLAESFAEGTDQRKKLDTILATTSRIAKIVHGLRTFSRDASTDAFAQTPVQSIIDDSLALCRARFKSAGIDLRVSPVPQGVTIDCQATQISQVLLNLLNNCHDAIEAKPKKWIALDVKIEPTQVIIRVTDSGEGIAPDVREKMMRPFFTTKSLGKGTGLGLSISCGIIASHSGRLYYDESSPNTSFVIEIPRGDQEKAEN